MQLTANLAVRKELLNFAEHLADLARPIAMAQFCSPRGLATKPDQTPVTLADRIIEAALRAKIRQELPTHGIRGEEEADERTDAEFVWVIDPIDGTKAYASGNPLFGCLIGLLHRGQPLLGVLEAPALQERYLGALGVGAWSRNRAGDRLRLATAGTTQLADAVLYLTTPDALRDDLACRRLQQAVRWTSYGADCLAYGWLARGLSHLVLDRGLMLHDWCALWPILHEAGGVVGDWQGASLATNGRVDVLAAANPALAAAAHRCLAGEPT